MARPEHGYPFLIRAPALPSVLLAQQESSFAHDPDGLSMPSFQVASHALGREKLGETMDWPDYSWRCRPKQATENAAGTSVAVKTLVHEQGVPYFAAQLRCSGRDFGDLVPVYANSRASASSNPNLGVAVGERQGASRRWRPEPAASALPLTTSKSSVDKALGSGVQEKRPGPSGRGGQPPGPLGHPSGPGKSRRSAVPSAGSFSPCRREAVLSGVRWGTAASRRHDARKCHRRRDIVSQPACQAGLGAAPVGDTSARHPMHGQSLRSRSATAGARRQIRRPGFRAWRSGSRLTRA
jgi:hypothetical protein